MPRIKCFTAQEAVDMILNELDSDTGEVDMVNIPPDDDLSDEDEIDDSQLGEATVVDVPGTVELHIGEDDDEISREPPKKRSRQDKAAPVWRAAEPMYSCWDETSDGAAKSRARVADQLGGHSPVQLFEELFTDEIMEHIQRETLRYALEIKNDVLFSMDKSELRAFIGILIFSGYVKMPSERMYWSEAVDMQANRLVREAMTRSRYVKIKQCLHVQNNNGRKPGDTDRGFKVRPLIKMLNENFVKFGIYQENLAVDEMMVRYYGHHGLKQYMRGKPIRFGYKLWALCGADGFCHKFDLYCGKETRPELQGKPLGSRVVLDMVSAVEDPKSHCLFFDNFFTSRPLLSELKSKGMRATGTVRENRMEKCPLKTNKELVKEGRGAYDARFDRESEVLAVRWFDNKSVNMLTNYDSVHPLRKTQRFNRCAGGKVDVPQPRLFSTYNDGMGGVDLHDWHLSKYNIAIRGKKWYWCLLTRMIDMAIVNAWMLHKVCTPNGKDQLSQLEFRRDIAVSYLRLGSRTSTCLQTSPALVPHSLRYDGVGHLLGPMGKRLRCRLESCSQKPSKWCTKCQAPLCMKCFVPYHTM